MQEVKIAPFNYAHAYTDEAVQQESEASNLHNTSYVNGVTFWMEVKPSLKWEYSESRAVGEVSACFVHSCVHNMRICLEIMCAHGAVHVRDSSWATPPPPR